MKVLSEKLFSFVIIRWYRTFVQKIRKLSMMMIINFSMTLMSIGFVTKDLC